MVQDCDIYCGYYLKKFFFLVLFVCVQLCERVLYRFNVNKYLKLFSENISEKKKIYLISVYLCTFHTHLPQIF